LWGLYWAWEGVAGRSIVGLITQTINDFIVTVQQVTLAHAREGWLLESPPRY